MWAVVETVLSGIHPQRSRVIIKYLDHMGSIFKMGCASANVLDVWMLVVPDP